MSDTPHFCHSSFGCDCAGRIAELEAALTRYLNEAPDHLKHIARDALGDADGRGAAEAALGFPEASVAAEGLVRGCGQAVELRHEHDRRL